jgi:DNA-binding winged helix-turn-helix (wHTH) protein/TolB-like protein/Tfp pilus assembly protein PilF
MGTDSVTVLRFGEFTLIPSERLLLQAGHPVTLAGKAFDLLVELACSKGRLVSKEELLSTVWPRLVVEEVNLSVNISFLRKVLTPEPAGARWIETVPKRGYRFGGPIEASEVSFAELAQLRTGSAPVAPQPTTPVQPDLTGADSESGEDGPPSAAAKQSVPTGSNWLGKRTGLSLVAVLSVGIGLAFLYPRVTGPERGFDSVAVLPFTSETVTDEYVADGIAEGVINRLTLLHDLRVTPRTSAFRYQSQSAEPQKAGRELRVAAVVTGKVLRSGDRMRLQVDLIDVARNAEIWGANYEGESGELIRMQEQMLQEVAHELRPALSARDKQQIAYRSTQNPDAYRAYLEARYYWNQRTPESLQHAVQEFQRAVQMDPGFALAYSGLADSYTALGYLSYLAPRDAFPLAKRCALKALALDPSLAEAHASLAYEKFYFEWDWKGADAEFKTAIQLNPHYPITHQWYSIYLLAMGQASRGLQEIKLAQEYDPLSLPINTDIGFHYYYTKRYDEAVRQLGAVLAMKKDFALAHLWLGRTYQQMGKYNEALEEFRQAEAAFSSWPVLVAARGSAEAAAGSMPAARATASELQSSSRATFVTSYGVALVYAGLNDKDAAFVWLAKAFEERSNWMVWLRLDPRWDNIRSDPRFSDLVRRMEFPP